MTIIFLMLVSIMLGSWMSFPYACLPVKAIITQSISIGLLDLTFSWTFAHRMFMN